MWSDILKASTLKKYSSKKIKGDIFREVLADYIESTGSLDFYIRDKVLDDILQNYIDLENLKRPFLQDNLPAFDRSMLRGKMNHFVARYLPEDYEVKLIYKGNLPDGFTSTKKMVNAIVKKNTNLRDDTTDLEKIRTRSGDRLKLKDWEAFKRSLRAGLNATVPRNIYGRKSNVRITDGDFENNKATLNISFRSLQEDRRYIHINFIEENADYYFTTIEGNIQLYDDEVVQTEAQLREKVIDLVEEFYELEQAEYDLREKEEDELTEEENIRQLEAANPDSYWDKDRAMMVPKEKPPEEELPRNLNLEEAAKLGAKAKEKADKLKNLLAEKKRRKGKGKDIKPVRGKRGRRDVS